VRAIRPSAASNGAAITSSRESCERRYVYCVYRSRYARIFHGPGMAGRKYPVYAINYADLAAVVSASPAVSYESTRRNMTTHMRVQEEVMGDHAILPIQFNTVSPNVEAVRDCLLAPGYSELIERLEDIAGCIELGVKAFWRQDVVFRELLAENENIRRLRDLVAGRPPEATFGERLLLGEMVEKALRLKRERESAEMLARLQPHAEGVRLYEPFSQRMTLNAAVLLKAGQRQPFERSLDALDEELGERMLFKCVGPTPPYNFVELTLG
jgi:hypothetical protein